MFCDAEPREQHVVVEEDSIQNFDSWFSVSFFFR